jgi:hypothetical protein
VAWKSALQRDRSEVGYLLDGEVADDLGTFGDSDHGARLDCLSVLGADDQPAALGARSPGSIQLCIHLRVTNEDGGWVAEMNTADGSWVRVVRHTGYGLYVPAGIALDGTGLWVTSADGNSVTELAPHRRLHHQGPGRRRVRRAQPGRPRQAGHETLQHD